VESIDDLETQLSTKVAERERLEAGLRAVNARRGWLGSLMLPFRSARVARAAADGIWRELRSGGWRVIVALIVISAGGAAVFVGDAVLKWLGGLAVLMGPAVAAWRRLGEYTESARKELLARKSEMDGDIRGVEEKLSGLDPARRLNTLLAEIGMPERYESYREITGRIHHDLRRLSNDLTAARESWERSGSVGTPPLQRIVLYVDDLDRCDAPPSGRCFAGSEPTADYGAVRGRRGSGSTVVVAGPATASSRVV
jgi:hypothetical protein